MLVQRPMYYERDCHADVEAFKQTVTSELQNRVHAKHKFIEQVKQVSDPLNDLIRENHRAQTVLKEFAPTLEEEITRFKNLKSSLNLRDVRTFSLTTTGALNISVPPYDLQWTSSFFDDSDANAGTFKASSIDSLGYQAAGLGLYVSSTIAQDVRFSADAELYVKWTDWALDGVAATDGGVGVIVYEGGNAIARNDATLWSDTQYGPMHIASGDDMIYLTQTSAGQTYFHMEPGRQYLVWVWAWVTAAILGNDLAISSIECRMPFVVVAQR
jgi:hypothetical protein